MSKRKKKSGLTKSVLDALFADVAFMKKFTFLIGEEVVYDFYYKGEKVKSFIIRDKREE